MEDDVYNGYFLPKDAIVLGNAWYVSLGPTSRRVHIMIVERASRAILHDDRLFPDPFTFKPERFIGPDVDPRVPAAVDYAFGFGRRVCPGRWMAHAFVWVVVASVLSAFRIEKVVRDGRVIEPTGAFSPGILACVLFSWPWDVRRVLKAYFILQEPGKIRVQCEAAVKGCGSARPCDRDCVNRSGALWDASSRLIFATVECFHNSCIRL